MLLRVVHFGLTTMLELDTGSSISADIVKKALREMPALTSLSLSGKK